MTGVAVPAQPLYEKWGRFELEPGLTIWGRAMLVYVLENEGPPRSQQLKVAPILVTQTDDRHRGSPSSGGFDPRTTRVVKVYEPVSVQSAAESLYLLSNGVMIGLRMIPQTATRYEWVNQDGDPFIHLAHMIQTSTLATPGMPQPSSLEIEDRRPLGKPEQRL
jgi:hypothetical protein